MKKTITAFVAASVLPLVALCQNYKIGDTIRTDDGIFIVRDFEKVYAQNNFKTESTPAEMALSDTLFPKFIESMNTGNYTRREWNTANNTLILSSKPYEEVYQAVRNVFSKEEAEDIGFRFAVTADFDGKVNNVAIAIPDKEPENAIPIQKWLQLRKELMKVTLAIPDNARQIYKQIWGIGGINAKRVYEKMPE